MLFLPFSSLKHVASISPTGQTPRPLGLQCVQVLRGGACAFGGVGGSSPTPPPQPRIWAPGNVPHVSGMNECPMCPSPPQGHKASSASSLLLASGKDFLGSRIICSESRAVAAMEPSPAFSSPCFPYVSARPLCSFSFSLLHA